MVDQHNKTAEGRGVETENQINWDFKTKQAKNRIPVDYLSAEEIMVTD